MKKYLSIALVLAFAWVGQAQPSNAPTSANGDFAYTVGYERSSVSVQGGPARAVFLRATQIYRRENGDWKLVHRHADPITTANPAGVLAKPG